MENTIDNTATTNPPLGLKIFATIYLLKSTIPILIVSIAKILEWSTFTDFYYFLSCLSMIAGKMMKDYSDSQPFGAVIVSLLVVLVYVLFITNNLNLQFLRKPSYLNLVRALAVASLVISVLTSVSGSGGYGTGQWNSVIYVLSSWAITIALIIYLFLSKELKRFFGKMVQ